MRNHYYQSAQWVTCALSLSYPKKKIVLGKGLKIVHYQTFVKKHNQSQKRNEKKRKEIKKKEEDELANQFNDTLKISKRRRVDDV